ncbi:alpha/beta fold hydrolase [Microbacterium sp. A93]|uniref:alpha/beta fold hydrolase n=1 Tax=Microbacterium sp. A93 TaxID=3450716 RepID=UPI003F431323
MGDEQGVDPTAEIESIANFARRLGLPEPVVRRRRLGTDSDALSALQWGVGDPEVVLLHGAGLHAQTWNRMMLELGIAALAIDLPGHGQSDRRPVDGYRVAAMGDQLAQALVGAGIAPTCFVAHSLGSFVGAHAAAVIGGIRTMVILDATPHRIGTADPTRMHSASLGTLVDAMRQRMPHRDRNSLERAVLRSTRERADGLREWLWDEAFMDAVPLRARERDATWQSFQSAASRTVLLRAEHGGVQDAEAEEFVSRVPRSSVVVVDGAGHNVHTDQPEWLARFLRNLLSS